MVTWQKDRLDKFRRLVDLDELPKPVSPDVGVVAEWPERLQALLKPGWKIFFENAWLEAGGAIGEWGLRRERECRTEQLAVKIYVSSHAVGPARRYFRHQAMSSTAPELPYKVEVSDDREVVTFLVEAPAEEEGTYNDGLLRLYRNVVFDVRVYDAEIRARTVADDLLAFAQEHANASLPEGQPRIGPMTPEIPFPGGELQVRVPAAPDPFDSFRDTPFEVQVQTRGQVDFLGFRDQEANFRWQEEAGEGGICVQAIDRRTLLSRRLNIKIPDETLG